MCMNYSHISQPGASPLHKLGHLNFILLAQNIVLNAMGDQTICMESQ